MLHRQKYERLLRTGTWPKRAAAAQRFAAAGEAGASVLVSVALDQSQPKLGRVTAFSHIPVTSPEALRQVIPAPLADSRELLRCGAIKKAGAAGLVEFIEDIKRLTAAPAEFWDLDELLSIRETATQAPELPIPRRWLTFRVKRGTSQTTASHSATRLTLDVDREDIARSAAQGLPGVWLGRRAASP